MIALPALTEGTLLRRYKRFLADIRLADGAEITAHVANPGAMTGLAEPGMRVWLSRSDDRKRKLAWSWELVEADGGLVGVNTAHPNRVVEAALRAQRVAPLSGYGLLRREVAYGQRSRVDFLLRQDGRPDCYVEVKNVHLRLAEAACFPDSVTARGARHLAELSERRRQGDRAVMLFLVQRGDCRHFRCADWVDPAYGRALRHAMAAGVETLCYACHISLAGIELADPMPIALDELP